MHYDLGMIENSKDLFYYGYISWLWSNSKLHRDWTIKSQARVIIPAVTLKQFHLILDPNNLPMAYCSWAWLNSETENDFIRRAGFIDPKSWNSGDRLWFIDYISPFSSKYTEQLNDALARKFPKKIARALRVKPGNQRGKIISFRGPNLPVHTKKQINFEFASKISSSLFNTF